MLMIAARMMFEMRRRRVGVGKKILQVGDFGPPGVGPNQNLEEKHQNFCTGRLPAPYWVKLDFTTQFRTLGGKVK